MSVAPMQHITLVCAPFAGAGASFYHPWRTLAGDRVRVVGLELPGRERRLPEEPHRDVHEAAKASLESVLSAAEDDAPLVLFGHSVGAVLMYELAHLLSARDSGRLKRLFVSGSPGPWTQRTRRATGLADDEFFARVEEFAGFRHEALDHPEMRDLILPALRADCEMHENYWPSTDEPLSIPIFSVRGSTDELATPEQAQEWRDATVSEFGFTEMAGGHMYLADHAHELLRLIEAVSFGETTEDRWTVAAQPAAASEKS